MHRLLFQGFVIMTVLFLHAYTALSHCEIPCGIYDDKMRISLLNEHIATIEKSMGKIEELQGKDNANQLVRWVMNKEEHANQFQDIVTQYFLTQRIKPDTENYSKKVELLHQMLVYAMKCKQTIDFQNTEKLKSLVSAFDKLYFAPHS